MDGKKASQANSPLIFPVSELRVAPLFHALSILLCSRALRAEPA